MARLRVRNHNDRRLRATPGTSARQYMPPYCDAKVTGFVTVSGNSHSFVAGLAAPALPPQPFEACWCSVCRGTISSTTAIEYLEQTLPSDHPLRPLYLVATTGRSNLSSNVQYVGRNTGFAPAWNIKRRRCVCAAAGRLSNAALAPHLCRLWIVSDGHGFRAHPGIQRRARMRICLRTPPARPDRRIR